MTTSNQKPIKKLRIGAVQADIWAQAAESGEFLTVSFSRSYKKGEEWKTGHSYQAHELEALVDVALDAKDFIRKWRRSKITAA